MISTVYDVTFHPVRLHVSMCHWLFCRCCCLLCQSVDQCRIVTSCVVTWCRVLCCHDIVRCVIYSALYISSWLPMVHVSCAFLVGNNISDDISCMSAPQITCGPVQYWFTQVGPKTTDRELPSKGCMAVPECHCCGTQRGKYTLGANLLLSVTLLNINRF